jgi:hypothetical protein
MAMKDGHENWKTYGRNIDENGTKKKNDNINGKTR